MRDFKPFELNVVNGVAVLLSFYLGYKLAIKKCIEKNNQDRVQQNVQNRHLEHFLTNASALGIDEETYSFYRNYKMILLVRTDLQMSKGKIAAQCGHGAVGAYKKAMKTNQSLVEAWDYNGSPKIALRVESEEELMLLKRAAEANRLNTCLICDAGHTQVKPNTKTVVAIGPGLSEDIDKITGHLKLL